MFNRSPVCVRQVQAVGMVGDALRFCLGRADQARGKDNYQQKKIANIPWRLM